MSSGCCRGDSIDACSGVWRTCNYAAAAGAWRRHQQVPHSRSSSHPHCGCLRFCASALHAVACLAVPLQSTQQATSSDTLLLLPLLHSCKRVPFFSKEFFLHYPSICTALTHRSCPSWPRPNIRCSGPRTCNPATSHAKLTLAPTFAIRTWGWSTIEQSCHNVWQDKPWAART